MIIETKPFFEVVTPIIAGVTVAIGGIVSALVTYFLIRNKTNAEIEKTETETTKTELENFDKLRQMVSSLAGDIVALRGECSERDKIIEELQKGEKKWIADNSALTARLAAVESTVKTEQKHFKEMLTQKNKEISGLKQELKRKVNEFEKKIEEKEAELELLRDEIQKLKLIMKQHNLQIDN